MIEKILPNITGANAGCTGPFAPRVSGWREFPAA